MTISNAAALLRDLDDRDSLTVVLPMLSAAVERGGKRYFFRGYVDMQTPLYETAARIDWDRSRRMEFGR